MSLKFGNNIQGCILTVENRTEKPSLPALSAK